ncbi:hypothetical protein HELRODRAFT_175459 [Helobdella robusta]|uniref:Protein quiver n=1 Tax=Helobdella robusta TaxID=6412 RepID=T1F9A2_HELRO|nr:hypothetical protein HELRODRAFT_175459 [Helobdella robusta]ESO00956.1 hypothetical protein HELRODRAFT_175459 [Helobdella robusta]
MELQRVNNIENESISESKGTNSPGFSNTPTNHNNRNANIPKLHTTSSCCSSCNSYNTSILFTIIVFVTMITMQSPLSEAVTCYECNKTQLFCQDKFTRYDADVPTCEGDVCYKKKVLEDGKYLTIRTCTTFQEQNEQCKLVDQPYTNICICSRNYCNFATKNFASFLTLSIFFAGFVGVVAFISG